MPVLVAVNKIDRPEANPQKVGQELVAHNLQPEDWGGTTQFADVSAKTGEGIDDLLERILLVADAELELQANAKAEASGPIIESRLDIGRGPVATMLVARGTLESATPSSPATPGARCARCSTSAARRSRTPAPARRWRSSASTSRRRRRARPRGRERAPGSPARAAPRPARPRRAACAERKKGVSLEELFTQMEEGALRELNIIVKADVQGSIEAVVGELSKIDHPEVGVNVIHTGIGAITEGDVMLASASNAVVIGFNVRPNAEARSSPSARASTCARTGSSTSSPTTSARRSSACSPRRRTNPRRGRGEALFRASRLGVIAGSYVTRGVIRRNAQVRVVREGTVIYETTISGLKRFKDDVREVQEGFECGILLDGFNDVKEGDVLEAYETKEIERTDLTVAGNGGAPDEPEAEDSE